MNKESTITERIYRKDLATKNRYLKSLGIKSFAEFFHQLTLYIQNHKRNEFYSKLTSRDEYRKPLTGCKIDKSKIIIQNRVATFV